MDLQIFSVFDGAVQAYAEPFVAPSIEFAIRSFREAVNAEGTQVGKHPADYTLFHIGSFKQETGLIVSDGPRSLGVAIEFVTKE